jgi:hypothetical protein
MAGGWTFEEAEKNARGQARQKPARARYTPTLLNGQAVPVIMTVTVAFP